MKIPLRKTAPRPKAFELGRVTLSTRIEGFLIRRGVEPHCHAIDEVGYRVEFENIPGATFFLHKAYIQKGNYHGWRLSEMRTGLAISSDVCDTMALSAGKARLTQFINQNGIEALMKLIKTPKPVGSLKRGFDGTILEEKPDPKPKLRIGAKKPLPLATIKPKLRIGSR